MSKVIKEIIIMLLVCLISILAFAVILYEYIPNRKVVAEVSTYSTSAETEALLADDIDSKENEVVLTYEVSSRDLSSYEVTNDYVPGKANPFESYTDEEVEESNTTENTTNSTVDNTTNENSTEKPSEEDDTETNSFIDDGGTK